METILIVDDEKNYLLVLSAVLEDEGYEVLTAPDGAEALEIQKSSDLDLVVTDMKMPGMDGIEFLEQIKARDPDLPVIMMTAHGTVDKAVEAMQKGAYSYILKPFDNERLILFAKKAMSTYQVVKENRRLRVAVESQYQFGRIIGKSKPMRDLFETIQKVAPSNATVLIEGESGTGKELVAKAIHFNSPRRDNAFVAVNCSCAGRKPARKRALRARAGRVHRGHIEPQGPLRARPRRHSVFGRNRRAVRQPPGEAAAGAPGADVRARRRHALDRGGHPRDRRHQQEPAG